MKAESINRGVPMLTVCLAMVLAACSPQPSAQGATGQAEAPAVSDTTTASADLDTPQTACWLLPAATVSKILGETLTPTADLGAVKYGNTSCNYYARGKRPGKGAPRLTVTLDWNGFNLMAMHIPEAGPATEAAPYADIGDGALLDGNVLFVRTGERSLALDLRDAGDLHASAQQLVAAAKTKLKP